MPAYPFKDATIYHMPGNMERAPTSVLKVAIKPAKLKLAATANAGKVILEDPLP